MTSHELAHFLLELEDTTISATAEIRTGKFDKHGDEIIAHLECYDLIDSIPIRDNPFNEKSTHEIVLQFESSGSRSTGIDVCKVVSDYIGGAK